MNAYTFSKTQKIHKIWQQGNIGIMIRFNEIKANIKKFTKFNLFKQTERSLRSKTDKQRIKMAEYGKQMFEQTENYQAV